MNVVRVRDSEPDRLQAAIVELQDMILRQYPTAQFSVAPSQDEPLSLELTAVVDVDDADEVLDLVLERVLEMQMEEGLAVHVVPIQTPERSAAVLARERGQDERDGDGGRERRRQQILEMQRKWPLPSDQTYPVV